MKKKFKKILSLVTVVTLLVSMLSFWSVPASADHAGETISPGDSIFVPSYTCYYEVILSGFTAGTTYNIQVYIPRGGNVILQSFGTGGGYAPNITLLNYNATQVVCQDSRSSRGFKTFGYEEQTLINFHAGLGDSYTLRLKPSTSNDMRLSFTIADGYFDENPITYYEDIQYIDGVLCGTFDTDSNALVGLVTPPVDGEYPIVTSGFAGMQTVVIDPSTNEFYRICDLAGEVETSAYLEAGVTYYVVLFIPDGILDMDSVFLSISIG